MAFCKGGFKGIKHLFREYFKMLQRAVENNWRVFMEVCGVTIDFEKQNGYFFNADCMEGMKQFPDKYFDLAVVDPPYGDGLENSRGGYWNRFGERFDRYKQTRTAEERQTAGREHGVMRTGGTWAAKFSKKSLRGMSPRNRNTLKNCFASHETRLSGGAITLTYRRHGAS